MKLNEGPLQNDEDDVPSDEVSEDEETVDLCSRREEEQEEEDWDPNLKPSREERETEEVRLVFAEIGGDCCPSQTKGNPSEDPLVVLVLESERNEVGEST